MFFQILGLFILVTIITFELALHICIYIIHTRVFLAGYGWFEEKSLYFNTQIRVYRILFTDETIDYVPAEDFDGIDFFFIVNVSSEIVYSVHSLPICVRFQLI